MNLDALKNRHRQAMLVDDYRQAAVIANLIARTEHEAKTVERSETHERYGNASITINPATCIEYGGVASAA